MYGCQGPASPEDTSVFLSSVAISQGFSARLHEFTLLPHLKSEIDFVPWETWTSDLGHLNLSSFTHFFDVDTLVFPSPDVETGLCLPRRGAVAAEIDLRMNGTALLSVNIKLMLHRVLH